MQIKILLYDGFDEMDALPVLDVLHAAGEAGADLRVGLVRLGSASVTSAHGLEIHVVGMLAAGPPPEVLVLPGAGWLAGGDLEGWPATERDRIGSVIAPLHQAGTAVAAVGTGVLILAASGILAGRAAASRVVDAEAVRAAGVEVVDAAVVDDGDIVTATGATAGFELALWLVERYAGAALADAVGRRVGYERRVTNRRPAG